jgi:hypothetical protein
MRFIHKEMTSGYYMTLFPGVELHQPGAVADFSQPLAGSMLAPVFRQAARPTNLPSTLSALQGSFSKRFTGCLNTVIAALFLLSMADQQPWHPALDKLIKLLPYIRGFLF